jgi:TetR/AcrR family transcriptional regulator
MTIARRDREREERRSCILEAAEAVFMSKGFDQATMDDIAAEAELSKGTLYLYFRSKDDLFSALSARMIEAMVMEFEALCRKARDGLSAVRAMLQGCADSILAQPQHFRILMGQLASGHLLDPETPSFSAHRHQVARIVTTFVTALERGKRDRTVRADIEPVQTSGLLWAGLLGTMLLRINSDEVMRRFPQPVDMSTLVHAYIELVCDGLRDGATGTRSDESETLS